MNYTKLIARMLGSILIAGTLFFAAKDELPTNQHKLFGVGCALLAYALILSNFQQANIEELKDKIDELEEKLNNKQ